MASTKTILQEAQEDLESQRFQEVDLLESLNFQKEPYSQLEPLSLSDNLQNEPFDLNEALKDLEDPFSLYDNPKQPILETENEVLQQSFQQEEDMYESYKLKNPTVIQDNIQEPADLFEAQLDLQDPLRLKKDLPSPKEEDPDSLEWDPLIESITLQEENIKQPFSLQDSLPQQSILMDSDTQGPLSLPQQSILMDSDTQGPLSLQEYGSGHYSSPPDLRKFTLGLNEDDNGPKEYYGPQRPDSETYASLNTSMRPKLLQKSNKLKKFDHYLVEFDDDEVLVQKCNTLNNNEINSESLQSQKKKTENKRKSLSRKAKMYVTSEIFKRGEIDHLCKEPKLMSENTIPEIVDISKSSENPKKTKVVIKGLEKIKKSDIGGVLGHLNNYITDNAISTALNEHTYFNKSKTISTKDFSNLSYSNVQPSILRQMALQAGLFTLNEFLDQGVLDITNHATVQLGQILTFSLYFHKNIRELAQVAWQSQPVASLSNTVHEVPSHLAVGTCLVALTDQMEGATLDETWVGLGCLGLTYLYQVARNNKRVKESKQQVEK